MPLGIEMPDGKIISDAEWHNIDDVMRGAHGFGVKQMPGALVKVDAAFKKIVEDFEHLQSVIDAFDEALIPEERCEDYSWLFISQCAHCLGHEADWEIKPKVVPYD